MRILALGIAILFLASGVAVIATGLAGPVIAPDAPSAAGSATVVGQIDQLPTPTAISSPGGRGSSPTATQSPGPTPPIPASSLTNRRPGDTAVGPYWVTRVTVPNLNIDLPVIEAPPAPAFPPCDVAMYLPSLKQPGEAGATYLFAHARTGMFLPILEGSQSSDGVGLLGLRIRVYTSDDRYWDYQVVQVRRHQRTITDALSATRPELWLQTSEGPSPVYPKVQLVALPTGEGQANDAEAHPEPHPLACS